MATVLSPRIETNALRNLCRQVLSLRLVITAVGAPFAPSGTALAALALTFVLSYALHRGWERFGPLLLRHRWLLVADMALTGLLLAAAGPTTPVVGLVALGTPLLAGLVHGWRGSAVYAAAQAAAVAALGGGVTLCLLCGVAGAAASSVRGLLPRFAEAVRGAAARAERERLAREMHDSVSKTLHGLALAADALTRTPDPERLREQAALVADAARTASAESRALLTDLRAPALVPALRSLTSATPGASLTLSTGLPSLPPPLTHHLHRLAAEAVENARRHACAAHIAIGLSADADALTLTVEDDGIGLPAGGPDRPGHFGLLGMRERATEIGAALHLGPRPAGPGTRLSLVLPFGGAS
ncbi:histidine kinase [Streptomyces sp. NBC_00249]|uniref:sensor histidine kinase n=1 Tax=Streptomyces sp. NBC_00249 TaxID=2975690 RepID=UPI002250E6A3|nr:histidine kinase [Streptomyces sp. NBC_00249]MCX5194709.1 histidine kinase [Streptomyces sp. NBC_00249]